MQQTILDSINTLSWCMYHWYWVRCRDGSDLDVDRYTISGDWQKKTLRNLFGKKVVSNNKLSELDQAFIRLLYPPDLSIPANVQPFLQAMRKAGVPEHTAGMMLNVFVGNNAPLVERLTSVRNYFNVSMEGSFRLFNRTCSKVVCFRFPAEIT